MKKQIISSDNIEAIVTPPFDLLAEERAVWEEFVGVLKQNIKYRMTETDRELIRQYCQLKVMRDRAWIEYMQRPDRYIKIVIGICQDGKTPKIVIKENEHYKTLIESNKHLEKLLKDLRLTPEARKIY